MALGDGLAAGGGAVGSDLVAALGGWLWYRRLTSWSPGLPVPLLTGLLGAGLAVTSGAVGDLLGGGGLIAGREALLPRALLGFLVFAALVWWLPLLIDDLRQRLGL